MKKIILRDKKKTDFSFYAYSNIKGIFMRTEKIDENKKEKCVSLSRYPGAFAFVTEDGSIKLEGEDDENIQNEIAEREDEDKIKISILEDILYRISIALIVAMFLMFLVNLYLVYVMAAMSLIFMGLSKMSQILFIGFKQIIFRDKNYIKLARFHSAEHAAINAYYDLNRVPTLEEIKKYSSFSYRCGTVELIEKAWPYIALGICRFFVGIWFWCAIFIMLEVSIWAYNKNFFFAEFFTLAKPRDLEYEVAIKAMTQALKNKEENEQASKVIRETIFKMKS